MRKNERRKRTFDSREEESSFTESFEDTSQITQTIDETAEQEETEVTDSEYESETGQTESNDELKEQEGTESSKTDDPNVYGDYRAEGIMAEGRTTTIYKAVNIYTKESVTLKTIPFEDLETHVDKAMALNEVRVACSICHPHVLNFIEAFMDVDKRTLWYMILIYYSLNHFI